MKTLNPKEQRKVSGNHGPKSQSIATPTNWFYPAHATAVSRSCGCIGILIKVDIAMFFPASTSAVSPLALMYLFTLSLRL